MPTYDHHCARCGPFEVLRPMAARQAPAPCPGCGADAPRVVAGAARLQVLDDGTRRLITSQERASGDGTYARMRHPMACGCCRPRRASRA